MFNRSLGIATLFFGVLLGGAVSHCHAAASGQIQRTETVEKSQDTMKYPDTKTVPQTDVYFGTTVADPYRWLEDDVRESKEVANWVTAQNEVTFGYLQSLPHRDTIQRRLTQLWNFEKYLPPQRAGKQYFFAKNDGLQNQNVVYRQMTWDGPAEVFIDPNAWSADGTVALSGFVPSPNGDYVVYGVAEAGSDWTTWRVIRSQDQMILDDEIRWSKFSSVSWAADGSGFYYCRYDAPVPGQAFQSTNLNQKIFFHRLGDPQDRDELVHADAEHPEWGYQTVVTDDGRYLIVTVWVGTDDRFRILYRDLTKPKQPLVTLVDHFENEYTFVGNDGSRLYFKSDLDAPSRGILVLDVAQSAPVKPQVVIPESTETLVECSLIGNSLVAEYLKDAVTVVKMFDLKGQLIREVKLPGIGTASGFDGRQEDRETFFSFASFNQPADVYRMDLTTGETTRLRDLKLSFQPNDYQVTQVFYNSKDGTRVPMFIAHRKGVELNGKNPTLLYGYGGFNISLTPAFSVSRLQWMEMGGILAIPNLRGGGEYGKKWHQAGTKTKKQNVFDDFIAAAEWLIANQYTSPKHLAIQGGSNGGLLVGACMTQRPDLYAACLPAVGVMDMLRFQKFTAGRFWTDDYGSSEASADEFQALVNYSPYHNLNAGTEYPATLVTTADTDDRVVPGHSFKFAARLQAAQAGKQPTLIRIETRAGHGAGKPTAKIIEEAADQWAFLVKHLQMNPTFPDELKD